MKKIVTFLLTIILAVSSVFLVSCSPKIKYLKFKEFVFGIGSHQIPLDATLYGTNQNNLLKAKDEIIDTLKTLNKELNTIDPESVINKFNNYGIDEDFDPNKKFYVSKYVFHMLSVAQDLYEKKSNVTVNTNGKSYNAFKLFNPAVYPLMELWELDATKIHDESLQREIPTPEQIDEILPFTDFTLVDFGQDDKGYFIKKLHKEVKIDFGGQAKGYGADLAVEICKKYKLKAAIIDIGGNVYLYQSKPLTDGTTQKFSVVINMPDAKAVNYFCALWVEDISLVTSGDYNRHFVQNNIKYAHILNPLTGLPVNIIREYNEEDKTFIDTYDERGLVSVTIIHQNSELADIYAKIVMLLGMEKGVEFMEENSLAGVLISNDHRYAAVGDMDQFDHNLANGYKKYEAYKEYKF